MTMWIPFKAKTHEQKNRCKKAPRPRLCRICGKPTGDGRNICYSCGVFVKVKQKEERKGII